MEKRKSYEHTKFSPQVVKDAAAVLEQLLGFDRRKCERSFSAAIGAEQWKYNTEDEFFADYRSASQASFHLWASGGSLSISFYRSSGTTVEVGSKTRGEIEAVFEVFETHAAASRLPEPPVPPPAPKPPKLQPKIFIGHGRSPLWRDLKDHLQDQHGYQIVAYEVGARAGHTIRDVLDDMLTKSSMAFLLMTAEDETADGGMRARQNVVHEVGLFQGKLGFSRAIVLLEDGAEEFSNIHGINQIRFSKGNIRETFGEVLATIRREFFRPDA